MATLDTLQQEIDLIKSQIAESNKKISFLQKQLAKIDTSLVIDKELKEIEAKQVKTTEQEQPKASSTGPFILLVVGIIFSATGFGLIIGLPMILLAIYMMRKNHKTSLDTVASANYRSSEIVKPTNSADFNSITNVEKQKPMITFEEDVGMKWFARIGILALVIGIGFFIKYAIDMEWITHLARIIAGVILGIALILSGQILSKQEKYAMWAKTLVGGGLAITYFVIFAAYHFVDYRLATGINQVTDIILLILVVISAIILSVKDNSQIIAAGAFFLGYITSLLANDFDLMTLLYGMLLTFGLVTVVSYKKWSLIGFGGIIVSYLMYLIWLSAHPHLFAYASFILVTYFVSFTLQTWILQKEDSLFEQNIVTILINSAAFYILYYFQINDNYPDYTGVFTIIMSFIYSGSFIINIKFNSIKYKDVNLYLALLFLTLAIPVQLNHEWITIIWAVEALLLSSVAIKLNNKVLRTSSYIVGVVTFCKTIGYDVFILHPLDIENITNSTRLFSILTTIICFYAISYYLKKSKENIPQSEWSMQALYSWTACSLLVFITFLELITDYPLTVTILLAIYALVFTIITSAKTKEFIYQASIITLLIFAKVVIYDTITLQEFSYNNFFASTRFFAYLVAITTCYLISWYLQFKRDSLDKSISTLPYLYSHAASTLTFILILLEMEEFWISVGWTALALTVMVSGFMFNKKHLRMQGMVIFTIVIVKVFLYDTRNLETIYRTISYMVLGGILLLVSFIYTKYKDKLKEIL